LAISALAVDASSARAEGFEIKKVFGPDGTGLTGFSGAGSVAIDQSKGIVYVFDGGHFEDGKTGAIFKFDLEGNPVNFSGSSPDISGNELSGISIEGFPESAQQIAVDPETHEIYVTGKEGPPPLKASTAILAFEASGEPSKFTAGPGVGTNELPIPETSEVGGISVAGVAVDTEGNIYVSDSNLGANRVFIYTSSGALLTSMKEPTTAPANLAVDSKGDVYLTGSGKINKLVPSEYPVSAATTYTKAGTLSAERAVSVAVDPKTNEVYVSQEVQGGSVFDENGTLLAEFGAPGEPGELGGVSSLPLGLAVSDTAERVFVAHRSGGDSGLYQIFVFQRSFPEGPPTIEGTAASKVTADSAGLRARINPNTLATTYWFEYGFSDCALGGCTSVPLGGESIGSGHQTVAVAQAIAGLQGDTVYHYRVVAENELDVSEGPDKTFTTQGGGLGFQLSDSRAWEMVSPPNKHSGRIVSSGETAIQAALSGNGLAYASFGSIVGDPASSRLPEPATVLARRGENGAWSSRELTPSHTAATRLRPDTEFKVFTDELNRAEMEPTDSTPLSPDASERTPYLWSDGEPPLFTPLLTPANVPPESHFGPEPGKTSNPVRIEGATPSLDQVVIRSENAALVQGAALRSIYSWRDGGIEAVSKLPESEGGEVVKAMLGSGPGSVRHAFSSDGSRIFWSPTESYTPAGIGLPALYLWDRESGKSVRLDTVKSGGGAGQERPAFNVASADGRVVFFTDSQRLTKDASPSGRDLYRCEIGSVGTSLGCVSLTDISAPLAGSGDSAGVLDQVSGSSEDGARLYFVARGVLTEEPNGRGEGAEAGRPNLYFWEEGSELRFVASLSNGDFPVWGGVPSRELGYAADISAAASPDGRFFAFTSEESLTGYENRNESGEPNTEVFVFGTEQGRLACVSCNPSGAAAVGMLVPNQALSFPPDPAGLWANRWAAATLPEASQTETEKGRSLYRPRSVLDSGRVFFNSVDPLVPADSNEKWDVYQYEPAGVGSCTESTSTAAVSKAGEGCVGLLSSGTSDGNSGFLDSTPSGNDVFFLTQGRLAVFDQDEQYDVYDARVNGVPAALEAGEECSGETCQSAVGPPSASTPASESFEGPEGSIQCSKGQRRVHRNGREVCVRKKHGKRHHRKPTRHHKQAGKNGRAER